MATTILAHFDGQHFVPDEPVDLPVGAALRVHVDILPQSAAPKSEQRLSLTMDPDAVVALASDPRESWRPLNVAIDPELGRSIAEGPEFNIEEA